MEQNQLYLIKSGQNSFVETEGEVKIGLSGGNIGFGTTEPEAFMHVTGNTQIDGDLTVKGDFTTVNSSTIQVDDKNIEIGVGATTDAAADGGGITLHGATNKTINWSNANDAWTSSEHLRTADGKHVASDEIRALDGDGLKLYDDGGNGIFVEDGGNVGVGTTNPTVTLDVVGAGNFTTSVSAGSSIDATTSVSAGSSIDATTTMSAGTSLTTPIVKAADENGLNLQDDGGNGIFVEDGGNVGVGTTDPSATLDVVGSGNFSAGLYVDGNAVVTGDAGKWEDGAGASEIYYDAGSVGVGTSNPSATLDVVGSGNFSAGLYVDGNAVVTGAGGKWEDGAGASEIYYNAGNVGVGTSDPSVALDVVGAGAYSTNLTVGGTVDTNNLTFDQINSVAGSNNNDVIAYNGSSWTVKAASQLGLGGGSTSSQAPDSFETSVPNGASQVAITFSETYDNVPQIAATVEVNGEGEIIPHTVSGVSETGYHVVFSEAVPNANYSVHTLFGAKDVYWETGASDLQYSTNDVKIGQNLTVSGSFYGDQVRANSSAGLKLYDDGGNGMFIEDGGNVGIGTTNPVRKLHVADSHIRVNNDYGLESDGGNSRVLVGNATISLETSSNEAVRINSAGNVGIGTTNPVYNLHLANSSSANFLIQRTTPGGQVDGITLNSVSGTSINNRTGDISLTMGAGAGDSEPVLRFSTTNGASATKHTMFITNGNVGIGTTNPNAELEVNGQIISNRRFMSENSLELVSDYNNDGSTSIISFKIDGQGVSDEKMRITSAGNVGIGTTNPLSKLTINNKTTSSVDAVTLNFEHLTSSGGQEQRIKWRFGDNATENAFSDAGYIAMGKDSSWTTGAGRSSYLSFATTSANTQTEKMRIESNGNVGIGITNPGYKMDVVSNVSDYVSRLRNDNSSGSGLAINITSTSSSQLLLNCLSGGISRFRVQANGTAYTGQTIVSSDDRVKHNEQTIVGALQTLSKITPKKYIKTAEMYDANHDFNLDSDGNPVDENGEPVDHRIEAGVIAQQVLTVDELAFAVSPEGIDEDGTVTSPHSLDYNSLFTYAIAAIQEQQSIIEDLKSRIETLEQ